MRQNQNEKINFMKNNSVYSLIIFVYVTESKKSQDLCTATLSKTSEYGFNN